MNRKRLIVICLAIVILVLAGVGYFLLQKTATNQSGQPVKSKVAIGETVVPSGNVNRQSSNNSIQSGQPAVSQSSTPAAAPTNQQFYDQIVATGGIAADSDGQVRFGITNVKEPLPGWFVVTVSKTGTEPNEVIFQQTGNANSPLTVVAGPGTDFPPEYISLPDAVRKAL